MTKILMRAGFSPMDNPEADRIILENLVWENAGNMLFPYSIMRILMREDTEITAVSVNHFFSAAQAAEWSREYDYFVIPLANAFRDSFLMQLKYITALVKKLTIPCIVKKLKLLSLYSIQIDRYQPLFSSVTAKRGEPAALETGDGLVLAFMRFRIG